MFSNFVEDVRTVDNISFIEFHCSKLNEFFELIDDTL